MKKILVTNDDGIDSDGIRRLAETAAKFGEVWIVAPCKQYSAMSHSATFWTPIDVWPVDFPVEGVHAFATSGTPSDCICVALNAVLPFKPDAVFCGINKGYNIASSIQYSGTCGAAFEASNQGCHTIAFSENHEGSTEVADKYIEEIAAVLIDKPLGVNEIWNINFPGCTLEECKGVKYDCTVSQHQFFSGGYNVVKRDGDKVTYMIDYKPVWEAEEGTDLRAVIDNYVAVGKVKNYS
jgi:5'-nucleotidase